MSTQVEELRRIVQENIRIQRGGTETVEYVDVSRALPDIVTRQNHVVFGRRGCGKTLLLGAAEKKVSACVRVVYINCEDYKQHSFPNVLIEILDALFEELERNLTGWFGRKKKSREIIGKIRAQLTSLKEGADEADRIVKETDATEESGKASAALPLHTLDIGVAATSARRAAVEQEYKLHDSKIEKLNILLPGLKKQICAGSTSGPYRTAAKDTSPTRSAYRGAGFCRSGPRWIGLFDYRRYAWRDPQR